MNHAQIIRIVIYWCGHFMGVVMYHFSDLALHSHFLGAAYIPVKLLCYDESYASEIFLIVTAGFDYYQSKSLHLHL